MDGFSILRRATDFAKLQFPDELTRLPQLEELQLGSVVTGGNDIRELSPRIAVLENLRELDPRFRTMPVSLRHFWVPLQSLCPGGA